LRRAAVVVAAVAAGLLSAVAAGARLPLVPGGSSVGEGVPLKAYVSISPTVHLFGDAVTARLALVADTKWVDPARVHVATSFKPYRAVHRTVLRLSVGRFEQLTWTWTLRCLTRACVPEDRRSETRRIFHFPSVRIDSLAPTGRRRYGMGARWPAIEELSQLGPGVAAYLRRTDRVDWRFHMTPVASPTYRVSPSVLFSLVLAAGVAALVSAASFGRSWYRTVRPPPLAAGGVPAGASTLERALALVTWAHAQGDETLERKALERVADELTGDEPRPEAAELSQAARELAWSPHVPGDHEVETVAERARETGRQTESGEEPE
jgi:hypothetical protein